MRETQFARLCPHRKEVSHESDVREGQNGHADKCFHCRPGQPTATCLTSHSRNRRGCQPSAGIHFVITPSQHRWRKSDHAFHDPCSHPTRNSISLRQTDSTAQSGYRFGWALINLRRPLRWIVNERRYAPTRDLRSSPLDVLRERLALTGPRRPPTMGGAARGPVDAGARK
jgi:hypothetical protein